MTEAALSPNGIPMLTPAQLDKRYDACVKALNFELEQFWKQSLFFWALIGAAFVALAVIEENRHSLQAAIASFGLIASYVWTLANRGSRFRYEDWEHKLIEAEEGTTGPVYGGLGKEKPREQSKKGLLETIGRGLWRGKSYSPTQLIIAFSDYVVVFWFGILAYKTVGVVLGLRQLGWHPFTLKHCLGLAFILVSATFAVLVGSLCHATKND
jgi:hypothetical protein